MSSILNRFNEALAGLALLGLLVVLPRAIVAQARLRPEMVRAHAAFHEALLKADTPALDRLLANPFTWTHTDGMVWTKADLAEQFRSGKLRYAQLVTDLENYAEYSNSAVVTGHSARRYADQPKGFELRYTLTLAKVGRDWKVTSYHTSKTTLYATGKAKTLQERLGYPVDAKLLIINANDLAMAHSENAASLAALDRKLITSATVMVPCPWFKEVAE